MKFSEINVDTYPSTKPDFRHDLSIQGSVSQCMGHNPNLCYKAILSESQNNSVYLLTTNLHYLVSVSKTYFL